MFCLGLFGRSDWIQPVDSKETVHQDKTASAARNWTNIAPQTDATTLPCLLFPSFFYGFGPLGLMPIWLFSYIVSNHGCWVVLRATYYWAPPLSNANNTNLSDFSFAIFVIPLFCLGLCTFVLPLWPENSVIYHTVRATFSDLIKKTVRCQMWLNMEIISFVYSPISALQYM